MKGLQFLPFLRERDSFFSSSVLLLPLFCFFFGELFSFIKTTVTVVCLSVCASKVSLSSVLFFSSRGATIKFATLVFSPKNFQLRPKKKMLLWDKIREQRERKTTRDARCTPLRLVFPPGFLPGGHTHRSSGIPCGAQMWDWSLF